MFDADRFIENVHGQPSLWDKQAVQYSDRNARDKSWIEIGQSMYDDWDDALITERDARVKEMKKKWRHIRDNFFRHVNQGKSGDAAPKNKRKKEYVYADSLTFLLNSATKRQTSGNMEDGHDTGRSTEDLPDDGDDIEAAMELQQSEDTSLTRRTAVGDKLRRTSKMTPFQAKVLQKLDCDVPVVEDADRLFLLSMLPDYKSLTNEEKLDYKFMNLQFFREIHQKNKNNSPQPNTQTVCPIPRTLQHMMTQSPREMQPTFHTQNATDLNTCMSQSSTNYQTIEFDQETFQQP